MNSYSILRLSAALLLAVPHLHAAEPARTTNATAKSELEERAARLILPSLDFREATLAESVEFLRAKARALDPAHQDLNIVLPAAGKDTKITVTLKNIPLTEALHYVAAKAGLNVVYEAVAIVIKPGPPAEWKRLELPESPESTKLRVRATTIIVPKLEFREASLTESIDFLRQKAFGLDPEKRGVNIINLDLDPAGEARITITLMNVPLFEALRYIANLAGGELVAEPEALVVRQMTPAK